MILQLSNLVAVTYAWWNTRVEQWTWRVSSERRSTDADTNVINYKEEKLGLLQPLNVNQKFFKSTIIQKKKKEKIERRKNLKKVETVKIDDWKNHFSLLDAKNCRKRSQSRCRFLFEVSCSLVQRGERINWVIQLREVYKIGFIEVWQISWWHSGWISTMLL